MSARAWLAAGGVAAAVLELGLGAYALVALGPTRIALYPIACALATIALTLALWRLLVPGPEGPDHGDGGGGVDGGGPPEWWPDFERDLREYMDRESRPTARPRA